MEAFEVLVKCLLVVVQFCAMYFLLAMVRGQLVALLCVQVNVQLCSWLDRVL